MVNLLIIHYEKFRINWSRSQEKRKLHKGVIFLYLSKQKYLFLAKTINCSIIKKTNHKIILFWRYNSVYNYMAILISRCKM